MNPETKTKQTYKHFFFQELIESLFSACGKVDRVYLHKKPTAGLPERDKSKFFPTVSKIQVCKARIFLLVDLQTLLM